MNKIFKLDNTRVWRTYIGGKLIDEFHGVEKKDDFFPEEWITSTVKAKNMNREHIIEGLSKISDDNMYLLDYIEKYPIEMLGEKHFNKYGKTLGVLSKIIDSAERLTIQVHPSKINAKVLFNSEFGKTECWYILGERKINGIDPFVYIGFKKGITRETWVKLFNDQDINGMLNSLNKIEVKKGDVFFIEGGVPHAIGSGCFLVEIQEPTDYTIRVEKTTPSGFKITDEACHQGLGFSLMFDCFSYDGYSKDEVVGKWKIEKEVSLFDSNGTINSLIGDKTTNYFSMEEIICKNELIIERNSFYSMLVLEGNGEFIVDNEVFPYKKAEQFFVPASTRGIKIKNNANHTHIISFFGPRSQ